MGRQVLIVEDEPGIRDNIEFVLAQDGFECVHVATVAAARAFLNEQHPDFIILDVGLPDDDGFSLCREIRKTASTPILFLTARADVTDRVVGLELGGDDYMVKPFSPRELLARVKTILRRVEAPRETVPVPFSCDPDKHKISYFGQDIVLSRYEYLILETLIDHPGRVYSRSELMDLVWEEPGRSYDRTVDTHIKTIRNKLRAINGDIEAIETHRGFGYALREEW